MQLTLTAMFGRFSSYRMRDDSIITREFFPTKQFENHVEEMIKSVTMLACRQLLSNLRETILK